MLSRKNRHGVAWDKSGILPTESSGGHVQLTRKIANSAKPLGDHTMRRLPTTRRTLLWGGLALVWCAASSTWGDEAAIPGSGAESDDELFRYTPPESFQLWITERAREQMPSEYEKTTGWGNTTRILSGWKVEREGIKVETRRRYKEVNHGTWKKYRVVPIRPDEHVLARVLEIREQADATYAMDVVCHAKLNIEGRISQWSHGLQLVSLSAEAVTDVSLFVTLQIKPQLNPAVFPPTLSIDLEATKADIIIDRFRLQRISKLDGPLVKSLSDETKELAEEAIEKQRSKLLTSLNKAIVKHKDKLKLNPADLLSIRSSARPVEKTVR
ncbi:hypothetical protein Psta_0070 [Pirellula staleyi DSM 6068]|uniref:Uncharacterized protein n=1 Tax=Pirellula staleyi (strain ATCC 27377 / DSM 6068 / ICPB 4128) TaxID=530564 RepID=D2R099_PIRSD|nr:hypothetical protein Psta_0070 [Pirellula staleyi DSM 6068]